MVKYILIAAFVLFGAFFLGYKTKEWQIESIEVELINNNIDTIDIQRINTLNDSLQYQLDSLQKLIPTKTIKTKKLEVKRWEADSLEKRLNFLLK